MANQDGFAGVKIPRSPVYGTKGMVVSGHSLASTAGYSVLERGGSVIDAAVAASAVLSVVIPQATSLGGDAFFLYHDAEAGRTVGLNATGHAPEGATPEVFKDGMLVRGPLAASVPGMVRGLERIHERYGRLPWAGLFDAATEIAEAHPASRILANALGLYRADVDADPGLKAVYVPDGGALQAGDIVRQPALAQAIRDIAKDGSAVFYEGRIARSIGDYCQARGGLLGAADFEGYEPEWVEPLTTDYRGRTVAVMPPNSYGLLMLMQLNGLSGIDSGELADDDAFRLACLMRAMQAAFAEGRRHIADPKTYQAPIDDLLGPATTAKLQDAVANGSPKRAVGGRGGTSCIVIADSAGNGLSLVQSVFHQFGSAVLDPGSGVLLNNRMMGFTNDPSNPSVVAPGKRPSHTLNPALVRDGGKLRYLLATPGGPSQTMTIIQVLTNLVDRGMELTAAIDAPRWSVNLDGGMLLEEGYAPEVGAELTGLGQETTPASGALFFGSTKTIEVLANGVLCGAADTRREASAVGA